MGIQRSMVSFPSGPDRIEAHLALRDEPGRRPRGGGHPGDLGARPAGELPGAKTLAFFERCLG